MKKTLLLLLVLGLSVSLSGCENGAVNSAIEIVFRKPLLWLIISIVCITWGILILKFPKIHWFAAHWYAILGTKWFYQGEKTDNFDFRATMQAWISIGFGSVVLILIIIFLFI